MKPSGGGGRAISQPALRRLRANQDWPALSVVCGDAVEVDRWPETTDRSHDHDSHRLLGEALTGAATPVGSGGKPLLPP